MRQIERVINSEIVLLQEIVVRDKEDLEDIKAIHSERNFILGMDMLPHLDHFDQADYIVLTGGELDSNGYEPLYRINPRALVVDYENTDNKDEKINLSRFERLEYLFTRTQLNCSDYSKCYTLKSLVVFQWKDKDLSELCNTNLDSLEIIRGELTSLELIHQIPQLKVLYLSYLRKLVDVSPIKYSESLKKLKIENCRNANLKDLVESKTLNYLSISGHNEINSLNHLEKLPNLTYFLLDGCFVEDGDIECLKKLRHAVLFENRKHYSVKDCDLPKNEMPFLLKEIPKWRQLNP